MFEEYILFVNDIFEWMLLERIGKVKEFWKRVGDLEFCLFVFFVLRCYRRVCVGNLGFFRM